MAQPRGRRPARGGGRGGGGSGGAGYSSRPQQGRGRANGGRGNGGYGGRGGGGGSDSQMPIIIGLAAVGVVAVIVLILLMSGGDDKRGTEVAATNNNSNHNTRPVAPPANPDNGPAPRVLAPLSPEEISRIHARIAEIGSRMPKAKRLKEEGFEAKRDGNAALAKEKWRAAEQLTRQMIEEANHFFLEFGSGLYGEERVEKYARRSFDAVGDWTKLRSDFLKYVETE